MQVNFAETGHPGTEAGKEPDELIFNPLKIIDTTLKHFLTILKTYLTRTDDVIRRYMLFHGRNTIDG